MASSNYFIQDNSDIENQKLDAAKKLFQKGDYRAALNLYLGMLNMSTSHKLYYEIGRCYYKLNELVPAEEYFRKSIALEDFKNSSYLYLGNMYYKQKNLKNAIENWIQAYAYRPDDESVCLNLATSYFSKGMKFQSIFYYEKYLKYAKNKSTSYQAIKDSITNSTNIGKEFYEKALKAISKNDKKAAIELLDFAVKSAPTNFNINYLLGKLYLEEKDYMHSLIYLKQALCLDNKSLDVLQKLSSVYINLGDYTGAYCSMRRLLPLVLHNQAEYLNIMKTIKELDLTFDEMSYQGHKEWADKYYEDNNYHFALLEYENCQIMKKTTEDNVARRIQMLKCFINPEPGLVRTCLAKGGAYYSSGNYQVSNKYFSKVLLLASQDSEEYKIAKSRVTNV